MPAFTYTTSPNTHTLCGPFEFEAFFKGVAVDDTTAPVKYFGSEFKFTVFSEDLAIANTTEPFSVTAKFADWPTVTKSATENINFLHPCASLFDFQPTEQIDPTDDEYSGTARAFSLTRFTVSPLVCEDTITYACTSVIGPDGEDYTAQLCAGFDGIFDGDVDEGTLSLTATTAQYLDGSLPPGTYTFTITGTPWGDQEQKTADFEWFLIDPCGTNLQLVTLP